MKKYRLFVFAEPPPPHTHTQKETKKKPNKQTKKKKEKNPHYSRSSCRLNLIFCNGRRRNHPRLSHSSLSFLYEVKLLSILNMPLNVKQSPLIGGEL